VLKSPDIPSVLVEMGFLTNAEDEANLRQSAYLDRVARQLAKAILAYLENSGR
jgi:N-acetylmuramoyl-L-alanine amidase